MRKHSKFITILLSALLAVCLVQTIFVQAFATEMGDDDFGWGSVSTPDEPTEDLYPVSMEIVKAPESVTVFMVKFQTVVSGAMLCCILFTATVKNMM